MKFFFLVITFFILDSYFSQNTIFTNKKKFYYSAILIQNGDTITKEMIIIEPFSRPWIFQARVQNSMKYNYNLDTVGLKSFVHYRSNTQKKREEYYYKNHKVMMFARWPFSSKKEITGYIEDSTSCFFIHPPRNNQYSITQIAPHPKIYYTALRDTACYYNTGLVWGEYNFKHKIETNPYDGVEFDRIEKLWEINGVSTSETYNENRLYAIFSKQIGFLRLRYKFYNNTEINLELVKVEEKGRRRNEVKVIFHQ